MRIDRIRIQGFGRLHDFDSGPASLEGLVVVLGPNEAGKSTLFTFLTTALYGFQPATRERNPQVPWGAEEAAGHVRIRLDGGGCGEVERRLRSQPSGRLTLDGVSTDLRNQPLPWVEHVPRTVFRQVFALTLADLANLDSETWARIQDKVVGTMGASDLRSARSAAEALEREAGEIWRPNRRGNQRLRALQAEGRELRARRTAAYERDARVRALVEERERVRGRLREARELRHRDRLALERAQSLLPLRRQRQRIEALRAEGGDPSRLRGLPSDPPARLAELQARRARLGGRLGSIERTLAERGSEVQAFDDRARHLLARREEIASLVASAAVCAAERARAVELQRELRAIERELDSVSGTVLDRPWRDVPAAALDALPVELLRDRVARAKSKPPSMGNARSSRSAAATIAVLVSGLAALAWGLVTGGVGMTALGAGLSAIALTLLVARRARAAGGAAAQSVRETAHREIRELVSDLPIREAQLARPGEALVAGLTSLQSLLRRHAQQSGMLEAAQASIAAVDHEAAELARLLDMPDATAEAGAAAESIAHRLDLEARGAERIQQVAATSERESRRLVEERASVLSDLATIDGELATLRAFGLELAPADVEAGLRLALRRLKAHRRADELNEELERAHPDLEALVAQIDAAPESGKSWTLDDEEIVFTRARLETLEEEIEQLVKRSEALERDAEHLRELETVHAVDSEIASLKERETSLVRERDRKWVLAKLLREADRRFREEHQPDLLRRASSYLEHLTGGRYERLVVDEREDADLFQVVGPGLPAPVPLAPPVSTGTLEQAYLSLRLAIVDHLDQGGERLPLFIDEVFVNWDRNRRARGLEVIAEISRVRQVFVFTCHDGLARELEGRGASVLPLQGG